MTRYRITETEVVAGVVLRNPKRRGGRDGDQKEAVENNYRALRRVVIDNATDFLAAHKFECALSPLQIYAIAAYQVTYVDEVRKATARRLGFKGVLAELLNAEEEVKEDAEEEVALAGIKQTKTKSEAKSTVALATKSTSEAASKPSTTATTSEPDAAGPTSTSSANRMKAFLGPA